MTSNPGAGHVGPLIPFVKAFVRSGDEVLVAAPGSARDTVVGAGLAFHPLGDPPAEQLDATFAEIKELPHEQQGPRVMREIFAGTRAQASLPGVLRLVTEYRPDILLRETTEYAGLLAAERLGVRHGRIGIMAAETETWGVPLVAPVLDRHRRRLGLRPDPHGDRIHASPYLTVVPEAMEAPADHGPPHTLRFREQEPAPLPLPDWWGDDERPLIYVTYGSVRPTLDEFPALFARTVAALAELPVRVLFTVGKEIALEPLGPVPPNVHVARWVAQAAVMPHAAAVVSHGGAGTTRMALAAGVPAVVVPGFADQPRNAERVDALGAGIGLGGEHEVPTQLGDAVMRLVDDPSYRAVARRIVAEVAALPVVDAAPAALRDWGELARAA